MKISIKRLFVFFCITILLCCTFAIPASAASYEVIEPIDVADDYLVFVSDNSHSKHDVLNVDGFSLAEFQLPVGTYEVEFLWDSALVSTLDVTAYPVSYLSYPGFELSAVSVTNSCFVVTKEMADSKLGDTSYATIMINSTGGLDAIVVRRVPASVIEPITAVWSDVLSWFAGAFAWLVPIFYNVETGLTFIGYLSIGGAAVAVALLFLCLVKSWLRFGR